MALKLSTGLRNYLAAGGNLQQALKGCVIKIYSGAVPADADAAETGTLMCTASRNSLSSAVKQKIKLTPTAANSTNYDVIIDGIKVRYTSDGSAIVSEIVAGMVAAINAVPCLDVVAVDVTSTYLTIEANTAGVPFDYSFRTWTGGDETTDTTKWTEDTAAKVEDAYGIKFETLSSVVTGILEKTADVISGVTVVAGQASHFRVVKFVSTGHSTTSYGAKQFVADTGAAGTTQTMRIQGTIGTTGADLNMSSTTFSVGATNTIDTAAITVPATRV